MPPVNIPIPTKIGSNLVHSPTNRNGIPLVLTTTARFLIISLHPANRAVKRPAEASARRPALKASSAGQAMLEPCFGDTDTTTSPRAARPNHRLLLECVPIKQIMAFKYVCVFLFFLWPNTLVCVCVFVCVCVCLLLVFFSPDTERKTPHRFFFGASPTEARPGVHLPSQQLTAGT